MNLNFSQEQEKALKKYAALQFPKFIDRFDTPHPIYLIMKNDGDWVSSSLDDAEYGMDTEEYLFERDDISENSIENFVMAVLGISEDEIEEYNNGLLDDNPPFIKLAPRKLTPRGVG